METDLTIKLKQKHKKEGIIMYGYKSSKPSEIVSPSEPCRCKFGIVYSLKL